MGLHKKFLKEFEDYTYEDWQRKLEQDYSRVSKNQIELIKKDEDGHLLVPFYCAPSDLTHFFEYTDDPLVTLEKNQFLELYSEGEESFVNKDFISALTDSGKSMYSIDEYLDYILNSDKKHCIRGDEIHEAGGSSCDEIAYSLGCFTYYMEAASLRGDDLKKLSSSFVFCLSFGLDLFSNMAKAQAFKKLLLGIGAYLKIDEFTPQIIGVSSKRNFSQFDSNNNIIRESLCLMSAKWSNIAFWKVSECDFLEKKSSISSKMNLVLFDEGSLGKVLNPSQGCFLVEKLLENYLETSWRKFQEIEALGLIELLSEQDYSQSLAEKKQKLLLARLNQKNIVVGQNHYPQNVIHWPLLDVDKDYFISETQCPLRACKINKTPLGVVVDRWRERGSALNSRFKGYQVSSDIGHPIKVAIQNTLGLWGLHETSTGLLKLEGKDHGVLKLIRSTGEVFEWDYKNPNLEEILNFLLIEDKK